MTCRSNDLASVCLLALVWSYGTARAGEEAPGQGKPPADLRADIAYPDVYINDSFEAADAIAQAKVYTSRGQWRQAAQVLQNISNEASDRLIRIAPGYYVGLREHINELIAGWPETGLSVYRSLYEPELQAGIASAQVPRSMHELLRWFDQYFCTKSAAALADEIGQLAIEAGDLAIAEHVYSRVLEHHPDASVYEFRYRAMLIVIGSIRGDTVDHLTDSVRQTTLRWMGRDRQVDEVVAEIKAGFTSLDPSVTSDDWPTFGGEPERARQATSAVDEFGLLWRFTGFETPEEGAVHEQGDPLARVYHERARNLTMQPVVSGGLVIAQRVREIVALHRNTGVAAWWFRADLPGSGGLSYVDEPAPVWDSVTAYDGKVYASLPGQTVPYYSYESAGSPPELACLDGETGRVIWRVDQRAIEEEFAETTFDTSPIVVQDRMYVVGRRRRSFGFEDCYLYRFNAANGALQQRTHLGSASTGTFGSQSPTMTIAALHGDTIYVCTNLGSIAAVYSHIGTVRWLRLYERRQADLAQGSNRYPGDVKPWRLNPVLWSEGRIVALPTDADNVLILDAKDGGLIDAIPIETLGHAETLLGIKGDLLCGVGREAVCFDLSTKEVRWSTPLPEAAELYGHGVWTGDRLLIPTLTHISTYSIKDGRRTDAAWEAGGEGGNLLALQDRVLVAGPDRISAYVRKSQIWDALRERVNAAPADPMPALELAEVALTNGELAEAVKALRLAVQRTELSADPLTPALSRRLSDDILMFVERMKTTPGLEAGFLDELYGYASRFAPDALAHLAYRFRFAPLFSELGQHERAVSVYQQILRDRSLRELPVSPNQTASESAGTRAQARIEELIVKHGRKIYAFHEAEAEQWLSAGRARGDEETLKRVVQTFPNSAAAPNALIARGELLSGRGKPKEAAQQFTNAYHRYPKQVDRPALLRKIANAYELADKPEHAYRWLTKAALEHPSVRFEDQGRLVGFLDYRERLAHVRKRVVPSRPHLTLPLGKHYTVALSKDAALLTPRFGDQPGSSWQRCFVRLPQGVQAVDPHSGEVSWSSVATVRGPVELLVARPDQAIFATPYELFAVDTETGERRWNHGEYPADLDRRFGDWEDFDTFRVHAMKGKHLLSVKDNGQMTCVALDTGELLWSQSLRPEPLGPVLLGESWVIYHVVQEDRVVVCLLDVATGAWFGAILTDERRAVEGLFQTLGGRIILVTSQSISCFDPLTHGTKWRLTARGHIRRTSLVPEIDALYFSEDGHRLKKISLENGGLLWESQRLIPRGDDDFVVALQDSSVIVSSSSSVSAVDALTGLTLWQGTTPDRARFATRLITESYVVAVDVPGGFFEAESVAYFYDHRNASGLLPREGGATRLGKFSDVRAVLAADGALLIQTGSAILGWAGE